MCKQTVPVIIGRFVILKKVVGITNHVSRREYIRMKEDGIASHMEKKAICIILMIMAIIALLKVYEICIAKGIKH